MTVYDVLFIINLLILSGITLYHCYKRQIGKIIYNFIVLSVFVLIKFIEVYYIEIRNEFYLILGPDKFEILRSMLSALLFFGSSITVGIQCLSDFVEIFVLLILALKAAFVCVKKLSKNIHSLSVKSENERIDNRNHKTLLQHLFLIYGKLLN